MGFPTETIAAIQVGSTFIFFLLLLLPIVMNIIFCVMTGSLARKKGYEGYYAMGFFLGILGLLYVGFLPIKRRNYNAERIE